MSSPKPYSRVKRPTITEAHQWFSQNNSLDYWNNQVEDVEMIEICLPRDKFPALLESQESHLYNKEREEQRLREEYPALQSSWEQYQIVLMMVK